MLKGNENRNEKKFSWKRSDLKSFANLILRGKYIKNLENLFRREENVSPGESSKFDRLEEYLDFLEFAKGDEFSKKLEEEKKKDPWFERNMVDFLEILELRKNELRYGIRVFLAPIIDSVESLKKGEERKTLVFRIVDEERFSSFLDFASSLAKKNNFLLKNEEEIQFYELLSGLYEDTFLLKERILSNEEYFKLYWSLKEHIMPCVNSCLEKEEVLDFKKRTAKYALSALRTFFHSVRYGYFDLYRENAKFGFQNNLTMSRRIMPFTIKMLIFDPELSLDDYYQLLSETIEDYYLPFLENIERHLTKEEEKIIEDGEKKERQEKREEMKKKYISSLLKDFIHINDAAVRHSYGSDILTSFAEGFGKEKAERFLSTFDREFGKVLYKATELLTFVEN